MDIIRAGTLRSINRQLDRRRELEAHLLAVELLVKRLAFDRKNLLIIVLCTVLTIVKGSGVFTTAYAGDVFPVLDSLSDQLILDRYFGRIRIALSSTRTLHCDFATDQAAVLASKDPVIRSLDALIRAKALRRDFAAVLPGETFWIQPLDRVRATVEGLSALQIGSPTDDKQFAEGLRQIDELFRALEEATVQYAAHHQLETESPRDPAAPYKVEIRVQPPGARVRFMPLLCYIRSKKFNIPLDDQWIDLQEGTQHLIGKYRYFAQWPKELSSPIEGIFEVREDSVITFTAAKR